MKLIKPSYDIWEQEVPMKKLDDTTLTYSNKLIDALYKHVEKVGRVCYKSEDKITETSAKPFVERLISSQHYAMLEHATVYLYVDGEDCFNVVNHYINNKYSVVKCANKDFGYAITTNFRVIIENGFEEDLKYLCAPTIYHAKRVTVHFVCDNGVAREFTRHRVFSFAQESTRYCNYSKGKFNNELTFIEPCWIKDMEDSRLFNSQLNCVEAAYMRLINKGWQAQQARNVLPLALKTELIMTGFTDDWCHFFDLRALGTTGAPHPQAKELAYPLYEEFKQLNYI